MCRLILSTDNIFEYFRQQARDQKTPTDLELLLPLARSLHRAYSSARGRDRANFDSRETSQWAKTVPLGSPWVPVPIQMSSLDKKSRVSKVPKQPPKRAPRTVKDPPPIPPFIGDHVLSQSVDFLIDAMNSREAVYGVAEGNIGRVYESIKVRLVCVNHYLY